MELNEQQRAEVIRLKQYFPYRVCFGAVKDGEFQTGATFNMRKPNKLARDGWHVEVAQR